MAYTAYGIMGICIMAYPQYHAADGVVVNAGIHANALRSGWHSVSHLMGYHDMVCMVLYHIPYGVLWVYPYTPMALTAYGIMAYA